MHPQTKIDFGLSGIVSGFEMFRAGCLVRADRSAVDMEVIRDKVQDLRKTLCAELTKFATHLRSEGIPADPRDIAIIAEAFDEAFLAPIDREAAEARIELEPTDKIVRIREVA